MDKIITKDPADLRLHKVFRPRHDAWADDDTRFLALCDDIRERGLDYPIKITEANEIVDGRHRWRAARRAGLQTIPCTIVDEANVLQIMVSTILHRRHFTNVQRAYVLVDGGLIDSAFEAARHRQLAGRKVTTTAKTVEDWSRELGVHPESVRQARKLVEIFDAHANDEFEWNGEREPLTLRDYYEPRILADVDSIGLGAAIAGIAGKLDAEKSNAKGGHPGGKPTLPDRQLDLFKSTFTTLNTRWEYWANFDAVQKDDIRKTLRVTIEAAPDDFLKTMERDILTEIKRRKEVA